MLLLPQRLATMSFTRIGLIVIPISGELACAFSIGNKVLCEVIINKHNKYKKRFEKDQQSIKSVNKLYRKSLQDNVIDKIEYESLCNIFTKNIDESKKRIFLMKLNRKKHKFFSYNKLKFQPNN